MKVHSNACHRWLMLPRHFMSRDLRGSPALSKHTFSFSHHVRAITRTRNSHSYHVNTSPSQQFELPRQNTRPSNVSGEICRLKRRQISSAGAGFSDVLSEAEPAGKNRRGQRVWRSQQDSGSNEVPNLNVGSAIYRAKGDHWERAVDDVNDRRILDESLARICAQVIDVMFLLY